MPERGFQIFVLKVEITLQQDHEIQKQNVRLLIITKIRKYKVSAIHIGLSEVVHRITVP